MFRCPKCKNKLEYVSKTYIKTMYSCIGCDINFIINNNDFINNQINDIHNQYNRIKILIRKKQIIIFKKSILTFILKIFKR